jgi:hypothetical protein
MPCGVPNQCSFAGVWAPDLPEGMTVYGMSYFYERPMQAKATHPKSPDAKVRPRSNPASLRACVRSRMDGNARRQLVARDEALWTQPAPVAERTARCGNTLSRRKELSKRHGVDA